MPNTSKLTPALSAGLRLCGLEHAKPGIHIRGSCEIKKCGSADFPDDRHYVPPTVANAVPVDDDDCYDCFCYHYDYD